MIDGPREHGDGCYGDDVGEPGELEVVGFFDKPKVIEEDVETIELVVGYGLPVGE